MARENNGYTPLYSEILSKLGKIKTKKEKVAHLMTHSSPALRMIIKSSFDPKIEWLLPPGDVPFTPNDSPEGTEHGNLAYESRKLYNYIKGGNGKITQNKRESMFVQMLENLHPDEADILVAAKDKFFHQKYKGLSDNVVKEAFNWDDNYMVIEHEQYPQSPGGANG
jgi:hypothetical protein